MFNKNSQLFSEIDKYIGLMNSQNKQKKSKYEVLEQRTDLLIVCMSLVERAFNNFMEYKLENPDFDIPKTINMDFKISTYANRLYIAMNKIIELFQQNATNSQIGEIFISRHNDIFELTKKMLFISARWDIERFINVYEMDISPANRAFPKRKPLLQTCIFFANRMNATKLGIEFEDKIMPKRIIFAVQPNSGKSFVVNVYSVLAICLHHIYYDTSGILRMSNNMVNACGFSTQIKAMIENDKIAMVFPEYKRYFVDNKCKLLEKSTSEEWKLVNLNPRIRASHFARGRDTAINSIRIFVCLIIDDLSDGFDQMSNDEAHKAMTTKYEIDMDSRKEVENIPEFIVGTMFNEFDVPNTQIKKLEDKHLLENNPNFANVRNTPDYSTVVIQIDCFDENGESLAPALISTEKLKDKQNSLKPFEFDLVYRQIRSSREPRIFEYGNLKTWRTLPETLSTKAIAICDPTRKNGSDYFSMPIFKENQADKLYYFTRCIYKQKSLGKLSDPQNQFLEEVVNFIIDNRVTEFMIENNTSNTIGLVVEEKLKEKGYTSCLIKEIFTARRKGQESKMQRILSQEATIINNIVFPELGVFPPLSDEAIFMEQFTRFDSKESCFKKGNHDDAPDSVAMFSANYLFNRQNRYTTLGGFDKKSLFC